MGDPARAIAARAAEDRGPPELFQRAYAIMRGSARAAPTPPHWLDLSEEERNRYMAFGIVVVGMVADRVAADSQ